MATFAQKKLPIGIQNLREIRENDYYYVDKSGFAVDLVEQGKYYFLSRPRRFGKSLLVDTLKELFEGNQALFSGLAAETRWDWSIQYPVLRFSFSGGNFSHQGVLSEVLQEQLDTYATTTQITLTHNTLPGQLRQLIEGLFTKTGQTVVVLVDEYDKPILDALRDRARARENRDVLRGFYGTLKDADHLLRFAFFTGVSKFSKVSLFSGLNNLQDITLSPPYSALCGYTDEDVDAVFAPELVGLNRQAIRDWYNGYNWLGSCVYNPFDVLLLFSGRKFKSYWFETGTPRFLLDVLTERPVSALELDQLFIGEDMLSALDVDHMPLEAVLFQTGYLTVKKNTELNGESYFTLGYPNREVRQSISRLLLAAQTGAANTTISRQNAQLMASLSQNDFSALENQLHSLYAQIPHDWYRNNPIHAFEGHYASVFYAYFAAAGFQLTAEDSTNQGQIDLTVQFDNQVFILEFKAVADQVTGAALKQIKTKNYAEKYRSRGEPVHLIGVEFSQKARNVVGFEVESLDSLS